MEQNSITISFQNTPFHFHNKEISSNYLPSVYGNNHSTVYNTIKTCTVTLLSHSEITLLFTNVDYHVRQE